MDKRNPSWKLVSKQETLVNATNVVGISQWELPELKFVIRYEFTNRHDSPVIFIIHHCQLEIRCLMLEVSGAIEPRNH